MSQVFLSMFPRSGYYFVVLLILAIVGFWQSYFSKLFSDIASDPYCLLPSAALSRGGAVNTKSAFANEEMHWILRYTKKCDAKSSKNSIAWHF